MSQFTGNLKNIQVNLIEASPNLLKKQQERLLADLKGQKINMFLTYDMDMHQKQRKDQKQTKDKNWHEDNRRAKIK